MTEDTEAVTTVINSFRQRTYRVFMLRDEQSSESETNSSRTLTGNISGGAN